MSDAETLDSRNELAVAHGAWRRFAAARLTCDDERELVERWFLENGGLEQLAASIRSKSRDPLSSWLVKFARTAPNAIGPQPVRALQALYDAAELPHSLVCSREDVDSLESAGTSSYRVDHRRPTVRQNPRLSGLPAREAVLGVLRTYKEALRTAAPGSDVRHLTFETRERLEALQGDPAYRPHLAKSLSQMSTALRKKGWFDLAMQLLDGAIEIGAIDSYILTDAIQCRLAMGDLQSAEALMSFACAAHLATDGMYAGLLERYAKMGNLRRAEELFDEANARGLAAEFCHTALIDGYGKSGQLQDAERLFAAARRRGMATALIFTALLDAYGKRGELQRARELFDESATVSGDRQSIYTALIDAYGKAGDLESAERLFDELRAQGTPSAHSYATLLQAHGKTGNLQRAQTLFNEARDRGTLTPYTYTIMIKAYRCKGRPLEAQRLYEQGKSEGVWR
jgi:pentatricopeptide repeat protein